MNKFAEYCYLTNESAKDQPHWRAGQTCMNILARFDPETYSEILYTDLDCFYQDSKLTKLMAYLLNKWSEDASNL